MNCQTCLATVSTAPLAEILTDEVTRAHWEECENCSRVVSLITSGERDLAAVLAHTVTRTPVTQTAETAIASSKRRRAKRVLSGVATILLAGGAWIIWAQVIVPGMRATADISARRQETETLDLECLSPEQAGELISPYVRSDGSAYYLVRAPIQAITVRATPNELKTVHSVLERFDNAAAASCTVNILPARKKP